MPASPVQRGNTSQELVRPLRRLLSVASSVVGAHLVGSILGLAFWTIATRTFTPEAVGVGSASVAAMTTAATIGMVGVGTLMLGELPRLDPLARAALARAGFATVALLSLLLGLAWAAASRELGSALRPIGESAPAAALFAVGVVLTAVTMTFDEAVLSSGRASLQFVRSLTASVVKLVALPLAVVAGMTTGMSLYACWAVGILCSIPMIYPFVRIPRRQRQQRPPVWQPGLTLLRRHARGAAEHHLINISLQVPMILLPVLAAVVTSARETGYFATARLAATFLFMFPFALALALFATTTTTPTDTASKMRRTLPVGLAVSGLFALATTAAAAPMLSVFGKDYATEAATPLKVLALGGLGLVIKDHYIALRRIEGQISRAAPVVLVGVALEIALSLIGGTTEGIVGLCVGWVIAVSIEALLVTPTLLAAIGRRRGNWNGDPPPVAAEQPPPTGPRVVPQVLVNAAANGDSDDPGPNVPAALPTAALPTAAVTKRDGNETRQ